MTTSEHFQLDGGVAGWPAGLAADWLAGWPAGWSAGQVVGWPAGRLAGWLTSRRESADRWRLFNKDMRFVQVFNTFLMDFAPRAVRGIKNMQKHYVKRIISIK